MQEATEVMIALPATDPRALAQAIMDSIPERRPPTDDFHRLTPDELPNLVGKKWNASVSANLPNGHRHPIFVTGWDAEGAANRYARPKALRQGAWAYASTHLNEHSRTLMENLARRVGGFVQYSESRTRKAGGDRSWDWISPEGECNLPGVDLDRHRLLRALGMDASATIDRMFESPEALSEVYAVLESRLSGNSPAP